MYLLDLFCVSRFVSFISLMKHIFFSKGYLKEIKIGSSPSMEAKKGVLKGNKDWFFSKYGNFFE